jgi:hypothetical protein
MKAILKAQAREWGAALWKAVLFIIMATALGYFAGYGFAQGASKAVKSEQATYVDTETGERWFVIPFTGMVKEEIRP